VTAEDDINKLECFTGWCKAKENGRCPYFSEYDIISTMSKNKVLLVYVQEYGLVDPAQKYSPNIVYMPLGVLYLGSYLKARGIEVGILDTRLQKKEDFLAALKNMIPETYLVGLSVMSPYIKPALDITRLVKSMDPSVRTVWGGIHATLFPLPTLRNEAIDYVIVKEGEKGLFQLAQTKYRSISDLGGIPNLFFKKDGKISQNPSGEPETFSAIGLPDYSLVNTEIYFNRIVLDGRPMRVAEVITARGCPHQCAFCVNVVIYHRHWYGETVSELEENLDLLIGKYNIKHVFFLDEDFFCNPARLKDFLPMIGRKNITWETSCRVDYLNDTYVNDRLLEDLRKKGCVKLRFGVESGSLRILELLKKEITPAQSLEAVKKTFSHGMIPSVSFMMGVPGETIEDILMTMALIVKMFEVAPNLDLIGPQVFRPYPGGELFETAQKMGLKVPEKLDDWSDFFIADYRETLPWIKEKDLFNRIILFRNILRRPRGNGLYWWIKRMLLKFHLKTKLCLIPANYYLYLIFKRILRRN